MCVLYLHCLTGFWIQLCITSYKMTVHVILSPVRLLAHALTNVWLRNTQLHWLCKFRNHKRLNKETLYTLYCIAGACSQGIHKEW